MKYSLPPFQKLTNDTTYEIDGVHVRTDSAGRDSLVLRRRNPKWEDDDSRCAPWIETKMKCRKATAAEIEAYKIARGERFDELLKGKVRLELSHTYVPTAEILTSELLPYLGLLGRCTGINTASLEKLCHSGDLYPSHCITAYRVNDTTQLCQSCNVTYLLTTDADLIRIYCEIWDRAMDANPSDYYAKRWSEMRSQIDTEIAAIPESSAA